ncbi:MAG TPA: iron-sulfur cluster-binding protein [Bacteroidales bacterium]|nr:MAG: iron-sulfur cluster-binding protein [Bacteroidetes bacterium GWF2_33_38]OFY86945.1 MAG: iron-sulfur cluster-binding protein [Bacteroidetes bacterium RIFOXYA2_FULL_33_7]HBF87982.1 iron-sulfur cluster-binding protein [Bacteroidales bacterium]
MNKKQQFIKDSEQKAFDTKHRTIIDFNIGKYRSAVVKGKQQFINLDLVRQNVSNIKQHTVENLDKYLKEFESNFTKNGGKIIWADTVEQALSEIIRIFNVNEAKTVVKSKSMATEEINLNEFLEKNNIEVLETDLGEYIVQLANEKPYHLISPAMHKSKQDVADLFYEKFSFKQNAEPEELTEFVRQKLRKKFVSADVGISGANFLIADIGGIALTENEGNALLSTSFPKIHIAIAGIEKLIPSINDMNQIWPLLSTHGTGQKVTVYNSIITGPRKIGELDGPERVYLVLLNNGRTDILATEHQYQALKCIKCGACLYECPVFRTVGGHTYDSMYGGPIGSVITPFIKGKKDYSHLSFASTLCGKCAEICPVKIPINNLLLHNRADFVNENLVARKEKISFEFWTFAMSKRIRFDFANGFFKNIFINIFAKNIFGKKRQMPRFYRLSFSSLIKKKKIFY